MTYLEMILIIGGISLDIFAAMEIEGAMLAEVKRKSLLTACTLVTVLQLVFFFGGYFVCHELAEYGQIERALWVGQVIAICVFALLGVRLLVKAIKREFINETCGEITVSKYIKIILVTSVYTLIAGCACGFMGVNWFFMLFVIILCSVLVVLGGIYTGYHFGFQAKTIAYVIGAILLWGAGVEILIENFVLV